jgi:hypothetical protein
MISGTDLVSAPVWSQADPEAGTVSEPYAQSAMKPAVGAVFGLTESLDLGLRISPQTPPLLKAKMQFSGGPESTAKKGNVSFSLAVALGFLSGKMQSQSTSFFLADIAAPFGYRLTEHHLFFLSPFLTIGSASGLTQSAAQTTASSPAQASVSATQYGAGLGYQFDLKYLDLRAEATYTLGSIGATQISSLGFGLLTGFEL